MRFDDTNPAKENVEFEEVSLGILKQDLCDIFNNFLLLLLGDS